MAKEIGVRPPGELVPTAVTARCDSLERMADGDRRTIIDRANRMLKQSKTLRKLSEELLNESNDIRASVKELKDKGAKHRRRKLRQR